MNTALLFPNQLFEIDLLRSQNIDEVYLVEEYLFFKQFNFHKQKLAYHRASMQAYKSELQSHHITVKYLSSQLKTSDVRLLLPELFQSGYTALVVFDPVDDWLRKRVLKHQGRIELTWKDSPLFINTKTDNTSFFSSEKKFHFQTKFYQSQRKCLNILLNEDGKPIGGKWSFDSENRKKYPKGKVPPKIPTLKTDIYWDEAQEYVQKNYPNNVGQVSKNPLYPYHRTAAKEWFKTFIHERFANFGTYEDAMVQGEAFLNHSVLTPMLNTGLLPPNTILKESLRYAKDHNIPLNSTEGFVRQIIGWREFIRGMYEVKGTWSRNENFFGFERKMPAAFYTASTGILPVDEVVKQVLHTGYCHHIERLMVLGNFMLLCEINPTEVYNWFMELFIDAYDWVMVPNVYGMSQFADGGSFATKPYIGGSNYMRKMSNYPKGKWEGIWDALYWRFVIQYASKFAKNPRMRMMIRLAEKMDPKKKENHLAMANHFLNTLG